MCITICACPWFAYVYRFLDFLYEFTKAKNINQLPKCIYGLAYTLLVCKQVFQCSTFQLYFMTMEHRGVI